MNVSIARVVLGTLVVVVPGAESVAECSSFFFSRGGELFFGNTLDWHTEEGYLVVNKRNVTKRGLPWIVGGPTWTSRYGSLTINQWGREFPARGMNEAGLVIGEMTLEGSRFPTADARAALEGNQWMQYMLDMCATVEDVLAADRLVRIDADQYPSHFLFADRNGHALSAEWLNGRLVYHTGATLPVAALTNDTYENILAAWQRNPAPVAGTASAARFSRIADRMGRYNPAMDGPLPGFAFRILDSVELAGWTKWKLVFDVGRRRLMWQTRLNREFRFVDLGKLDFDGASPVVTLDVNAQVSGDASGAFTPYSYAANRALLVVVAEKFGSGTNPSWLADYYNLPERTVAATNEFWVRGTADIAPGGSTTLTAAPDHTSGATCQWQIDTGAGWRDLGEMSGAVVGMTVFRGVRTSVLEIQQAAAAIDGARFRCEVTRGGSSMASAEVRLTVALPPSVSAVPVSWVPAVAAGGSVWLTTGLPFVTPNPNLAYQWLRNGREVAGANGATLRLNAVQPPDAGLYAAKATGTTMREGEPAIVGVTTALKVIGPGDEIGRDLTTPNGNVCDQVLPRGAAVTVTADRGQVTRVSFVDLTNDIVQVEFSGAGALSLVLEDASGPAAAVNYNQPGVTYMKGHAGIVIVGADETTNVSVFSVGRSTALNQALFRDGIAYDGMADLAFIAIASETGRFGGVRTANANYFASRGVTGIYAPGVAFAGPVFVGNVNAFDGAMPMLRLGKAEDVRVAGGDLGQANGQAVQVSGIARLQFTTGSDSHGNRLEAQANRGVLEENGQDVSGEITSGSL